MSVIEKLVELKDIQSQRGSRVALGAILASAAIAGCGSSGSSNEITVPNYPVPNYPAPPPLSNAQKAENAQLYCAFKARYGDTCTGPDGETINLAAEIPQVVGGPASAPAVSVTQQDPYASIYQQINETEQQYNQFLHQENQAQQQQEYDYWYGDTDNDSYLNYEDPQIDNPSVYPGNDPNNPSYYDSSP